jgi:hypothetical protein
MNVVLLGKRQPNVRSLFAQNEPGLVIDTGDRNGASEAKRTWRRNLLTYSEQFDNAAWTKLQSSVTANSATAPDGTTTADSLIEDSSTNTHLVLQIPSGVSANTVFTMSVYVKPNGRNWIRLVENNGSGIAAYFDIQNGALGTVLGGTTAISSVGNGWYRCSIRGTTGAAQTSINFNIRLANANGGESYTGNGTSGVFIWGAQVELGTSTDYQPITDFNTEFKSAYPNHSLYVDSNGVAPAVYPGDQIGLVIDSSRGGLENLGAEKWVHASVDVNSTESQILGNQSYRIYSSAGSNSMVRVLGATTVGKWYRVEFTINSIAVAGSGVRIADTGAIFTTTGTKVSYWLADATQAFIKRNVAACDYTISNVSFKEIPGIHPYQTTSGSRPALCRTPDGGRRNLLTGTDAMATQSLTVLAVQHTLSFQGTGTVTLSGASTSGPLVGTGATNIVSLTFTPTAGSLTLTVTGTVQLAQLETGASRTAYQKVGLTSDVTESGKRDCWGLLADGSDDSLITTSVDFAGWTQETTRNLVKGSELWGPPWTIQGVSSATYNEAGPEGRNNATTFTTTVGWGAQTHIQAVSYTPSQQHVLTFWMKGGTALGGNIGMFAGGAFLSQTGSTLSGPGTITGTTLQTIGNLSTSVWTKYQILFTAPASGQLDLYFYGETSGVKTGLSQSVAQFQLEPGSTPTAYQPTGTDKMTVMAGLRKLSDAASACFVELGTDAGSVNGTFAVFAPRIANATVEYRSRGSTAVTSTEGMTSPAPTTLIFTGISDIAGDTLIVRKDGTVKNTNTGDQGSGNYANLALNLMRRSGGAIPFTGILYTLIIRGAATPTATIADFEKNLLRIRAGLGPF